MTQSLETVSLLIALMLGLPVASAGQDVVAEGEQDDRIGLADLSAYRAALSGKPTADKARSSDPPARVGFRELWDHPETYSGRRVTVQGRLQRTFRQGTVGSFPPLVEAWLFSAAGDPFCVVYPRPKDVGAPEPGRPVQFTGTFLKTVRYPAGDGDRLAPLIVGDRPPESRPAGEAVGESAAPPSRAGAILRAIGGGPHPGGDRRAWSDDTLWLGLILAAMAALVIARHHLRAARAGDGAAARRGRREQEISDPPLRFVDSPTEE